MERKVVTRKTTYAKRNIQKRKTYRNVFLGIQAYKKRCPKRYPKRTSLIKHNTTQANPSHKMKQLPSVDKAYQQINKVEILYLFYSF